MGATSSELFHSSHAGMCLATQHSWLQAVRWRYLVYCWIKPSDIYYVSDCYVYMIYPWYFGIHFVWHFYLRCMYAWFTLAKITCCVKISCMHNHTSMDTIYTAPKLTNELHGIWLFHNHTSPNLTSLWIKTYLNWRSRQGWSMHCRPISV